MSHVSLRALGIACGLSLLPGASLPPQPAQDLSEASILLSIEPLLVDADGIHPLTGARTDLVPFNTWGEHHNILRVGEAGETSIYYVLTYKAGAGNRIQLRLERRRPPMSAIEHEMTPMEAWSTTLLADTGRGGRLDLRVVPVLRARAANEPFDTSRFYMRLLGGPLIRYGGVAREDRVIFRELNGGGQGLAMGIPELGIVRLSTNKFPGSTACGWVRGHDLSFHLGEQHFKAWSTIPILPEDPDRPGKGWILYGVLEPNPGLKENDAYYGAWNPE